MSQCSSPCPTPPPVLTLYTSVEYTLSDDVDIASSHRRSTTEPRPSLRRARTLFGLLGSRHPVHDDSGGEAYESAGRSHTASGTFARANSLPPLPRRARTARSLSSLFGGATRRDDDGDDSDEEICAYERVGLTRKRSKLGSRNFAPSISRSPLPRYSSTVDTEIDDNEDLDTYESDDLADITYVPSVSALPRRTNSNISIPWPGDQEPVAEMDSYADLSDAFCEQVHQVDVSSVINSYISTPHNSLPSRPRRASTVHGVPSSFGKGIHNDPSMHTEHLNDDTLSNIADMEVHTDGEDSYEETQPTNTDGLTGTTAYNFSAVHTKPQPLSRESTSRTLPSLRTLLRLHDRKADKRDYAGIQTDTIHDATKAAVITATHDAHDDELTSIMATTRVAARLARRNRAPSRLSTPQSVATCTGEDECTRCDTLEKRVEQLEQCTQLLDAAMRAGDLGDHRPNTRRTWRRGSSAETRRLRAEVSAMRKAAYVMLDNET